MPTSQYNQVSKIIKLIGILNPQSILDIGAGFGKYGMLSREYLDVNPSKEYGKFDRRIDAVEAFSNYITPVHKYIYNDIIIDDITKIVDSLSGYDLIFMVDIFEHLEKQNGRALVQKLLNKCGNLLISVPSEFGEQHDCFDNEFEVHKAHWSRRDLRELAPFSFFIFDYESNIVLLSNKKDLRGIKKMYYKGALIRPIKTFLRNTPVYYFYKLYKKVK